MIPERHFYHLLPGKNSAMKSGLRVGGGTKNSGINTVPANFPSFIPLLFALASLHPHQMP